MADSKSCWHYDKCSGRCDLHRAVRACAVCPRHRLRELAEVIVLHPGKLGGS